MVVCCSVLFWYLDRGICSPHAEPVVRLSSSLSLYPHHRPCRTFQHSLQQRSMHPNDNALKFVREKSFMYFEKWCYLLMLHYVSYYSNLLRHDFLLEKRFTIRQISIILRLSSPEHGWVLQDSVLVLGPGHLLPPCCACLLIVLVSVLIPPPQALLHCPELPSETFHALHWQCTKVCLIEIFHVFLSKSSNITYHNSYCTII